jgi:Arf-GAP with SH3 domain, ANK repeat and PH domain-containing protein
VTRPLTSPKSPSPRIELGVPPRLRVPSAQSIESRVSDSDGNEFKDAREPQSPTIEPIPENALQLVPVETAATTSTEATKVNIDISCQRPGEDLSQVDDGPLFRATMKSLEQKTGNMRTRWKRVLRSAEAAREAHIQSNNAFQELMDSLRGASNSNANAVQPAIDHYFDKIAKEILAYEKLNTQHIQKLIIDPISKLYNVDIKQAEAKKEDFERESKDYYQYVGRYLGQRQDSLKEKKRAETDSKYQVKRRNFELKRFDYSSFMQDLHGGRKDQEILSSLTRFADAQARGYLETAKRIEVMVPQLEALSSEVKEVDKEFQLQRTEREEKRRALEKSTKTYKEPDGTISTMGAAASGSSTSNGNQTTTNGSLPQRSSSLMGGGYKGAMVASPPAEGSSPPSTKMQAASASNQAVHAVQGAAAAAAAAGAVNSPGSNKFKGIRDLEDKDPAAPGTTDGTGVQQHRKEGLLWALSRPGSHVDPKGFNKQAWHKYVSRHFLFCDTE